MKKNNPLKFSKRNFMFFLCFLFLSFNFELYAENSIPINLPDTQKLFASHSQKITVPLFQSINTKLDYGADFFSSMISQEIDHSNPDWQKIEKIKDEKAKIKFTTPVVSTNDANSEDSELNKSLVITPSIGINFIGNQYNGLTPPDNSMAISDGGIVISVSNTNIEFDTTIAPGGSYYNHSLFYFFNDTSLHYANIYDPRVIYDSGQDRFIVVALYGNQSATSQILLAFSKTNNPSDGFWMYKIPGNLTSGCWFDYPSIATSTNELFISGNTFYNAGVFNQAVVLQIDKMSCYVGAPLNFIWWGSIQTGNLTYAFTVIPVPNGGQGNYGPGIYLVSHDNSVYSETELHQITNDLNNSPIFITYSILSPAWSPAPNAQQLGSADLLDNGDNRILSAFYLDSIIHFVFHADQGNGYNGIVYNRLNVITQNITTTNFGISGYDYSYPSVAHFGTSNFDRSVLICFLSSGPTAYPDVRVISCDNSMLWSTSTQVQGGAGYVDIIGSIERWGDYSGICRKKNLISPEVWVSGCYGLANHMWSTWIAQVGDITVGIQNELLNNPVDYASVYPNPVYDFFTLKFSNPESQKIKVVINNESGQTVKILYDSWTPEGDNIYTFNKKALGPGIYFINISSDNKSLAVKKIVILD